ncbi:MAG TPA: VWA domain-containing protein [Thermoanaerobaculia bacterium]|jgi:VWFA-related protein|nr:VWA domain-containing protein [Thermoanaerobaculia bacterium]
MRKLVLVSLLFAFSVQSQQKARIAALAAPPPLVEKIDVAVVNVDVTVTDRRGQPVPGLTRNDFEVFEDGKPQTITNFYLVENAGVHEAANAAAETKPPEQRFRRKVLVLIDNRNTTKHARNEALVKLEQFIDAHFDDGRYDWSIATVGSHVQLVLPMTSDKRVLHSVVQEIQRGGTTRELRASIGRGDSEAAHMQSDLGTPNDTSGERIHKQRADFLTQDKNFDQEMSLAEQTMFAASSTAAIVEAARAFGSSEGRKMILLVTGHMPFGSVSPLSRVGEGPMLGNHIENISRNNKQLTSLRDHLIHEANASNTSFYIIDAEGLEPPSMDGETYSSMGGLSPGSAAPDHSAEYWLARETGGVYMPGNRMEQSFEEFDRRAANFYSLGFVSKHPADMRYHRLMVRLKGQSGLKLQYRDGYSSAETDVQLVRALRSPLGAEMQLKTMPVSLIVGDPQYRGVTALVTLQAAMSMESLQYITDNRGSRTRLHVYVSIFGSDGRNITLAKAFADIAVLPNETATGPMTVTLPPLSLGKGTYNVVVAVRDELTDHVGVATHKIQV